MQPATDLSALPPILARLAAPAIEAARLILGFFGGVLDHETKADASPVTEADRRAERLIADRLTEAFPGIPIVAEEAISNGEIPVDLGQRFLLVDPLDGTREFVAGIGDFTVNIALVENGRATHGVVVAPAYGEIFAGSPGGAFKGRIDVDGTPFGFRAIAVRPRPAVPIVVISRSRGVSPSLAAFLADHPRAEVVPVGSSLKFCRVAEGTADIYPCIGRTMEWDTAAGEAVVAAAGGAVRLIGGGPLGYGKRDLADEADFANPPFVAWGGPPAAAG